MGIKSISLAVTTLVFSVSANSAVITIDAVNGGWYQSGGNNSGTNSNTYTDAGLYHSWLGFDITGVDLSNVTSATINIYNAPQSPGGNFTLYDVTSNDNDLGIVNSAVIYNDLATGDILGSGFASPDAVANGGLNTAGLINLSSQIDSYWAVGIFANDGTGNGVTGLFGWNNGMRTPGQYEYSLTIETSEISAVPVPAAVWLFGSGLIGLVGLARRKKS